MCPGVQGSPAAGKRRLVLGDGSVGKVLVIGPCLLSLAVVSTRDKSNVERKGFILFAG